ncbi:MAG: hypothetical protein ACREBQ_12210 [Nitrososphaerales archaeon]
MAEKVEEEMQQHVREDTLRIVVAVVACLFTVVSLQGQQRHAKTNPPAPCGDQSSGIPDFYYQSVIGDFLPPGFRGSLIHISEGAEIKLVLLTDGKKFELWTDTPETPIRSVNQFLLDLDQSCRLPPDPDDAVALIKLKWESRELSPDQFAQLHRDFTNALSQYVANAQDRYSTLVTTQMLSIYPDAIRYPIVYYNNHESIKIEAWDVPTDPVSKWVHELKRFGEESFHRPFLRRNE